MSRPDDTGPVPKPSTNHDDIEATRDRLKSDESLRDAARKHEAEIDQALGGQDVFGKDSPEGGDPADDGADRAFVPRPLV
ncbi:hypothetical protein [Chthonobacter rhizosphaerae]|uniref:hypothetical protein n=1 Tax=Chthonobacter rhizosphaerae TaxID=2735553 RepID=UPI0015EF8B26|nr:hypothetical protein [Chthonobacter rhizosphaerae]